MAKDFSVNILGLSKNVHSFEFQLGEDFFKKYGTEMVTNGNFAATVVLDKEDTFINADFKIDGNASLICDKSLDEFDYPITISKKIVFKYGEEPKEVSEEIIIITHDQQKLDVGQLMYEFIVLEVPIKKLHPRFEEEAEDETEGKIIYSSSSQVAEEVIDPRWEMLKKLK